MLKKALAGMAVMILALGVWSLEAQERTGKTDGKQIAQQDQRRGPGPGGPGQRGPGETGGRRMGGRGAGPGAVTDITSEPLAKDDAEKKILAVLDDMDKNQRRGMMNVPKADGRLLRLLVETTQAKKVVEIGTSNGYSGIWMALALQKTGGKLITHEIDEGRAKLARENFKRAGVEDVITLVFGDAHEEVKKIKGPVDVLFLDADKEGYIDYLDKLVPLVRPGGLIVAHNMNPRQLDKNYYDAITTDPKFETLFLNMHLTGISVTLKKH